MGMSDMDFANSRHWTSEKSWSRVACPIVMRGQERLVAFSLIRDAFRRGVRGALSSALESLPRGVLPEIW